MSNLLSLFGFQMNKSAGSGSSLGGSTDHGFSNNKKDQSNRGTRGDQDTGDGSASGGSSGGSQKR